jgi:hypothetical protein
MIAGLPRGDNGLTRYNPNFEHAARDAEGGGDGGSIASED